MSARPRRAAGAYLRLRCTALERKSSERRSQTQFSFTLISQPPLSKKPRSDFLSAQFAALKQANPGFPLLVREADGVSPMAYARYEKGVETSVPLAGLDAAGVEAAVGGLVAKGPRG